VPRVADPLGMNGMNVGKDGLGSLDSEATEEVHMPLVASLDAYLDVCIMELVMMSLLRCTPATRPVVAVQEIEAAAVAAEAAAQKKGGRKITVRCAPLFTVISSDIRQWPAMFDNLHNMGCAIALACLSTCNSHHAGKVLDGPGFPAVLAAAAADHGRHRLR
jgi:hypothetical protein